MYEKTARHINPNNGHILAGGRGQPQGVNDGGYGRIDGVVAKLVDETLYHVEMLFRNPQNLTCLVMYAEHQHPAVAVGEGR